MDSKFIEHAMSDSSQWLDVIVPPHEVRYRRDHFLCASVRTPLSRARHIRAISRRPPFRLSCGIPYEALAVPLHDGWLDHSERPPQSSSRTA